MRLNRTPANLALAWRPEEVAVLPYLGAASQLWDEWRAHNDPDEEQVYRKLLMDLWPDYRTACYFNTTFTTRDMPQYAEFNECTGSPIESAADYYDRTMPLSEALLVSPRPAGFDTANAMLDFILQKRGSGL